MARIDKAVFDAGPPIHLREIEAEFLFKIVKKHLITPEIRNEVRGKDGGWFRVVPLNGPSKEFCAILSQGEGLGLGEASGIALCRQEHVSTFFTDDLDARDAASEFGLSVHGTLGLMLRNVREGLIPPSRGKDLIKKLYDHSSLFLTKDLVLDILKSVDQFEKRN